MNTPKHRNVILIAILSTIPLIVWSLSVGNLIDFFVLKYPPGQFIYLFSKLLGLYAFYFMTLQLILGLQGRKSQYFSYHPFVGAATAVAVIAHFTTFIWAASLRTNHLVIDTLIPTFSHGFYKSAISYGALAGYILALVIVAGILQRKWRLFKMLHKLAWVVVILGWVHSFAIGTETRSTIIMVFYISLLGLALLFFVLRHAAFSRRAGEL
jgi:predicted ferric reductase